MILEELALKTLLQVMTNLNPPRETASADNKDSHRLLQIVCILEKHWKTCIVFLLAIRKLPLPLKDLSVAMSVCQSVQCMEGECSEPHSYYNFLCAILPTMLVFSLAMY